MYSTLTDPRDGNIYKTVKLRDGRWWLAENLRYETHGSFPPDKKPDQDVLLTNPDQSYDWNRYGRLYVWEAAKKAAPPGWHVPSDREWQKTLNAYGGFAPLHGDINPTGRNDLLTLIRDELDVQFGGCLNAANYSDWGLSESAYAYTYFGNFTAGRFWTSSRPLFDRRGSGLYYLLFLRPTTEGISKEDFDARVEETKAQYPNLRVWNHYIEVVSKSWFIKGLARIGVAMRSQENDTKAFSVRCIKD